MVVKNFPSEAPNVVIENPKARAVARTVLDVVGLVAGTLLVVDLASDDFDLSKYTVPLLVGYTYVRAAFTQVVDNTNTPGVFNGK